MRRIFDPNPRRKHDSLDEPPYLDVPPVLDVRARRGDPRGVGVVRRPDDEQAIDDIAWRLEMAFHIQLTDTGQTVRPSRVLGSAIFKVALPWCEIGRAR